MTSYLSGGGKINVEQVKELSKREFFNLLQKCDGTKDIVWDECLASLVNTIVTPKFLTDNDVKKMFLLSETPVHSTPSRNLIFITRPQLKLMDYIAENVHCEKRRDSSSDKKFYIFFLPRKSILCESRLKSRGVYGNFTGQIFEFNCDLFPFDNDLMSMEIESAFRELNVEQDPSCLYQIAQALMTLQALFGPIHKITGQGKSSKIVIDLLKRLKAERGFNTELNFQHGIDHVLLLDRNVDLLSPLATQLTYEGLIDEFFTIKNTILTLPADKFTSQSENKAGTSSLFSSEKETIYLNSEDTLFTEIRDRNFNAVGSVLSRKAKLIKAEHESRYKDTKATLNFVSRLSKLQAEHKSLTNHTTVAEMIKENAASETFLKSLQLEQAFMNGTDTDKINPYIEDLIAEKTSLMRVLRLICMQSVCNSGLQQKVLDHYKREIIQTYGFQHILSLSNLEKAGLLKVQQNTRPFTVLRKRLDLVDLDSSETNPTDAHYVHSVYAPLTSRLAKHLISNDGWKHIQDMLNLLPGPSTVDETLNQYNKHIVSDKLNSKVILVFFIGGCTFAEISALRFIAQKQETPVEFVIATTKLINGNTFLQSLMENLEVIKS